MAAIFGAVLLWLSSLSFTCKDSKNLPAQSIYSVTIIDRDPVGDDAALISHVNGSSDFNFNFATAWFPPPSSSSAESGLVVRVVECNPDHNNCSKVAHPQWGNMGAFAVVQAALGGGSSLSAEHIDMSKISWSGAKPPPQSQKVDIFHLTIVSSDSSIYVSYTLLTSISVLFPDFVGCCGSARHVPSSQ